MANPGNAITDQDMADYLNALKGRANKGEKYCRVVEAIQGADIKKISALQEFMFLDAIYDARAHLLMALHDDFLGLESYLVENRFFSGLESDEDTQSIRKLVNSEVMAYEEKGGFLQRTDSYNGIPGSNPQVLDTFLQDIDATTKIGIWKQLYSGRSAFEKARQICRGLSAFSVIINGYLGLCPDPGKSGLVYMQNAERGLVCGLS